MRKFIIVTESGSDVDRELVKLYNIHVIPMHVVINGIDYMDGSIPVTNVYDYYNQTKKIPTTSAVNPNEYQNEFKKLTEENPKSIIINISYSSKASCTYQNALIGSEGIDKIYHIDSLSVSGGEAAIIVKAAQLIQKNPEIEPADLVKKIEYFVAKARVSFIPGNLEYLKAGGRLSNAAYLGASILKLKPLIEILDGKLVATQKFRGGMRRIAEKYLDEFIDRYNMDRELICFIYSVGLEENIKQFMDETARKKGFKEIIWSQTGCVISTHCGPGAIGIAGFEI
jgi:DegV family protein with EDD domain